MQVTQWNRPSRIPIMTWNPCGVMTLPEPKLIYFPTLIFMTKSFVFEYMTGFVQIKLFDTADNDDGGMVLYLICLHLSVAFSSIINFKVQFRNLKPLIHNKANLRDLIAATGLVILLKLDSNCRFFSRETPNLGKNWPWNLTDDLQKQ